MKDDLDDLIIEKTRANGAKTWVKPFGVGKTLDRETGEVISNRTVDDYLADTCGTPSDS